MTVERLIEELQKVPKERQGCEVLIKKSDDGGWRPLNSINWYGKESSVEIR